MQDHSIPSNGERVEMRKTHLVSKPRRQQGEFPFLRLLLLGCLMGIPVAAQEVDQRDANAVLRLRSFSAKRVTVIGEAGGYFPVAARLKDGRIAAVLRGGGSHIDVRGRLDLVFSSDEGETWTAPRILVDGPNDDRNPAFGVAADGTVVLAYIVAYGYPANKTEEELRKIGTGSFLRGSGIYVIRSRDNGETWDPPSMISIFKGRYPSPYGKIVTLDDSSLLMTFYTGDNFHHVPMPTPGPLANYAYVIRSTDNGKTWGSPSLLGAGFDETGLIQTRNKDVLALMRSGPGVAEGMPRPALFLTRSKDRGKTWSTPERVTRELEIPADLLELPDGRIVLCHGQRNYPMGVHAIVSSDGGHTFNLRDRLSLSWFANNRDTGYPSSILRKDGKIVTLYYQMDDPADHPQSAKCKAVIWEPPGDWK